MKNLSTRGIYMLIMLTAILSFLTAPLAHAWDIATHTYIEEHLYKKQGLSSPAALQNRVYGASATDLFNSDFSYPALLFQDYLHNPAQTNFMKVWEGAEGAPQTAFAYGYVGHNNTWGMDSTAHVSGITYGRGEGYVIAKARLLATQLGPMLAAAPVNLQLPEDVLLGICHYLIESGVDLLVRGIDPAIGNKIMAAAYYRSDEVPSLLAKAFAPDFAVWAGSQENAERMIAEAESAFRARAMQYGYALTQDNALDLVAGGLAFQAKAYFAFLHLPAPDDTVLVQVATQGIIASMWLCAGDFEGEIRASTGWVNGNLSSAGIAW